MLKSKADTAFSVGLLFGSLYLWFEAESFPNFSGGVGGAFWPQLILVSVMALSVVRIYQGISIFHKVKQISQVSPKDAGEEAAGKSAYSWVKLLIIGALIVAYFVGLESVGFAIATFIFLVIALSLKRSGFSSILINVVFSILFTAALALLFSVGLSLELPAGTGVFYHINHILY